MRILCSAKDSHIFSTKNNSVFVILMFEIFNETLTNDVVSFEQLGPVQQARSLRKHGHAIYIDFSVVKNENVQEKIFIFVF